MCKRVAQLGLVRVHPTWRRVLSPVYLGVVLFVPLPAQTSAQLCEDWTHVDTVAPEARLGHAMVYDSDRQTIVLHGGFTTVDPTLGYIAIGDTWEWNAEGWRRASTAGPSARGFHAMAYDSHRAVTVLFGGGTACFVLCWGLPGATWEWNGESWSRRSVLGPSARYVHSMAFDAERGVTVLFGGIDGSGIESTETWEWNSDRWRLRATEGPRGRPYASQLVYDSKRAAVVTFDGQIRDLWVWTGEAWHSEFVPGPWPPQDSYYLSDSERNVVLAMSGADVWEWDGTVWNPRDIYADQAILPITPTMALDAARGRVLLFGGERPGRTPPFSDETWLLHQPKIDIDGDGDVDLADIRDLQRCLGAVGHAGPCASLDLDVNLDERISAEDFGRCLADLTGPAK